MWLIDNNTLLLRSVYDETVEKYAILSHTWEDGQEVTFQEMEPGAQARITSRRGYEKIRAMCSQALTDGLQYSWVDTCCIDKSSDSNLTQAINSMYRWYAAAEACYVFLADLDLGKMTSSDPLTQQLDKKLPGCRWFTRGWTLQELIAPRHIKFFDSAWRLCGSKSDEAMLRRLSQITNIPAAILSNPEERLPQVLAAQKMSWAAKRQTGTVEDVAYCLLGIFDINLPLIYGEGGRKAFLRLQEEIIRKTKDISLLAWDVDESFEIHGVFAASPTAFMRSSKIAPSDNAPMRSLSNASVVVSGLLGISNIPMVMVEDMLLEESGLRLQETFALPCRDGNLGNIFLPVCRTIDGYYRNSPKLVKRRGLHPNSSSLTERGLELYTTSTTNDISFYGSVDLSLCRQIQLDDSRSLPLMVLNSGPQCSASILTGYPARLFDASNGRFFLRNSSRERCMLLIHLCPPGVNKAKRIDWGMERAMYSTRQLVTRLQGVDSLFFLLSFQVDTGHQIEPLGHDLSRTAEDWHPKFSDIRMLSLHDLVQKRKDISFLDQLDRHPSSELVIQTCSFGSSPFEGCLARITVNSSPYRLYISFGKPPEATGQNPRQSFALQLEIRGDSSCLIM